MTFVNSPNKNVTWAWSPTWGPEFEELTNCYLQGTKDAIELQRDIDEFRNNFTTHITAALKGLDKDYNEVERQRLHGVVNVVMDDIEFATQAVKKTYHLPVADAARLNRFKELVETRNQRTLVRCTLSTPSIAI